MVVFDSDVLIDFLKKVPYAVEKINRLRNENTHLATTAINTFEIHKGAIRTGNARAVESLNQLLHHLKVYSFNFNSSKKAAEVFEHLKNKGETLDLADIMIASIVVANDETLLTRNIRHFNRIPELKIEKI